MLLSKITAMDPSTLTLIAPLQRIGRTFFTAFLLVALPLGAWAGSTTTEQRAYLHGHSSQSFEEVRNAEFKAYPKLKKLPLSSKAVWIKLHFDQVNQPERDRYLLLRHDLFEEIWLYRINPAYPMQWTRERVNLAKERFIGLGQVRTGDAVYLFIPSAMDTPLITFVGTEDEVINYEQRIDVAVAMIVAIGLGLLLHVLLSSFQGLNLMYAVSAGYLIGFVLLFTATSGALRQLMPDITIKTVQYIFRYDISWIYFTGSILLCLTISGLLKKSNVFRYAWVLPAAVFSAAVLYFIDAQISALVFKGIDLSFIPFITVLVIIQIRNNGLKFYAKSELLVFAMLMLVFIIGNASRVQSNWGDSINNNSVFEALDYPSILGGLSGSFFFSLIVLNALYTAANNRKRKELNQQLIATNINYQAEKIAFAKQRQLTGMLVHEIKNPLAASQFALANMERNLNDKDLSIDRLSTINQSLNEINTIIDKCLEVDLYEQGLLTTHSRTVALNELLSTLKTPVNEERIYIINRDLADELYISGDAFYIKTIFLNLVSNALKYSPDDSLVEIVFSTVRRDSQDLLSVSISNEPGIAGYPDKNQVFNRFYRAESARSVSGSGTGLWLAKQMARDIGAELELQDSAPNITFHLLLKMPPNKR